MKLTAAEKLRLAELIAKTQKPEPKPKKATPAAPQKKDVAAKKKPAGKKSTPKKRA